MSNLVHIKGAKELNAALQRLPVSIEKNILRSALRAGAKQYADKAEQLAPEDDGDLRASIRVSTGYKAGRVTAKAKAGNKKVWYTKFVEFGVAAHVITVKNGVLIFNGIIAKSVNHPGYFAKPFMRPAFDSETNDAIRAVGNTIRKKLTKYGINTPDIIIGEVDNE